MVFILSVIIIVIILIMIFLFARKAGNSNSSSAVSAPKQTLTPEQSESLQKAQSSLVDVRMTLSRLKDRDISSTGNEAAASIEKVLHALKEKPEKIQTTRQLFNYYLPTLQKVVSRYQRIESSGVDNPDIPEKLKKYLSDVKEAMASLYEGLYDNDKLHVEVDMEAMTMAIKRDGLLDEEDFAGLQDKTEAQTPKAQKAEVPSGPELTLEPEIQAEDTAPEEGQVLAAGQGSDDEDFSEDFSEDFGEN